MQKLILCFFVCTATQLSTGAQKISGRLYLEPGKTYVISMEFTNSINQQAAAQVIDFSATGSVTHFYKVIPASKAGLMLHHELQRMSFHFDGMGKTKSFDSDSKTDRENPAGKQLEKILSQKYELLIDSSGTTLMTIPEKISVVSYEDRMVILNDLVNEMAAVAYPPEKGSASFFKVLPGFETGIGDSWGDSLVTTDHQSATIYTLSAITDSTVVISFRNKATTKEKSEMMGMEAITRMNYTGSGTIVIDKATGVIREKRMVTDSKGTTEAANNTLPVTGKSIIVLRVREQ